MTPAEVGMQAGGPSVDVGVEFSLGHLDGVAEVMALWKDDVERRRFLSDAAYAVAGYSVASIRWLTAAGPEQLSSIGRSGVGRSDVTAIRSMTAAFRDLDNQVGGGRVRPTVVQYLHSEVAPLLRGSYTDSVGRNLFSAAAELTKLAGWMAYDEERHGIAQRYLIQALGMARSAGDRALGAEVLAGMSHQAIYIGRPGEAVDLARVARVSARRAGLAALESECLASEAHAHAARGDRASCLRALAAAEHAYAKAGAEPPDWLGYYDEAYLAAKAAHCFRDLRQDRLAATYAERSLRMADGYRRGRTFNLALLAQVQVSEDPREAVRVGHEALAATDGLSSRRARSYLGALRRRLTPHDGLADVGEFRRLVAVFNGAA